MRLWLEGRRPPSVFQRLTLPGRRGRASLTTWSPFPPHRVTSRKPDFQGKKHRLDLSIYARPWNAEAQHKFNPCPSSKRAARDLLPPPGTQVREARPGGHMGPRKHRRAGRCGRRRAPRHIGCSIQARVGASLLREQEKPSCVLSGTLRAKEWFPVPPQFFGMVQPL